MKIIIMGGGPSGLGVAWGLVERGYRNIIVVEKEPELGGLSGSFQLGKNTLDFGPHRFSPEFPEIIKKLTSLLGPELLEVNNEHAVVFKGKVYRYPPKIIDFLNIPTIIMSARAVGSFVWEHLRSVFKKLTRSKTSEVSFENTIVSRFGRILYDEVVKPICIKVWGDPNKLDPEFANLRFSVPTIVQWGKKILGVKTDFNDKVFYYPRLGFQQAWDRIGEYLQENGVEILRGAEVTHLRMGQDRAEEATIRTADGSFRNEMVDWVVSSIPTKSFLKILGPEVATADLANAKFASRGMMLAYYLVRKSQSLPARVIIAPESKYRFNRLSEQNQFSRDTVSPGHSAVLADVLTEVDSETWNMNDTEFLNLVARDIETCGFFSNDEIVESQVCRVPLAYPLPTTERESEQRNFNDVIGQYNNVLCTGRFASSDYNNSHTALNKGLLASESIHKKQTARQWYLQAEKIRKTAIRD